MGDAAFTTRNARCKPGQAAKQHSAPSDAAAQAECTVHIVTEAPQCAPSTPARAAAAAAPPQRHRAAHQPRPEVASCALLCCRCVSLVSLYAAFPSQFILPLPLLAAMSFWLISVPVPKSGAGVVSELSSATAGAATINPFDLPALKVGTLDQLMALRSGGAGHTAGMGETRAGGARPDAERPLTVCCIAAVASLPLCTALFVASLAVCFPVRTL